MITTWYLIVTIFVLEADGTIDERHLKHRAQKSELECLFEAAVYEDLFEPQLGGRTLTQFLTSTTEDETYTVGLSGELVAYEVGCAALQRRDYKEWKLIP